MVACLLCTSSASAEGGPVPGLDLVEVVRLAVQEHADVHIQAAAIAVAEATVEERAGAFDVVLTSSVGHQHLDTAFDTPERLVYPDDDSVLDERTSWRVGAEKLLDFGMVLEAQVQVERREQVGLWPSTGRARVALAATQALLRGRGSDTGPGAREAIAALTVEAEARRLRHTRATRALVAINAYWDHVAAHRRLAILRASETRAQALLAEVQMLIDNDERPAAEAVHFRALHADRQASRAVAELAVVRSRQALGLAMGVPGDRIQALAAPSDPLPRPDPVWQLQVEARKDLVARGVSMRADLAAAEVGIQAADLAVHAADRARDPRLDLQLTVGYSGLAEAKGAETLFSAVGGRVGGPDVGVSLSFAWPIQNRVRGGRLARQRALLERARLAFAELRRSVRAEITAGVQSLALEIRAHEAAKASAALHEQTVANQRRRLRSELSTAIDVLITEERLTGALLAVLASEVRHAQALARLHFAAASLLPADAVVDVEAIERLTRPPGAGPAPIDTPDGG